MSTSISCRNAHGGMSSQNFVSFGRRSCPKFFYLLWLPRAASAYCSRMFSIGLVSSAAFYDGELLRCGVLIILGNQEESLTVYFTHD